MSTFMELIFMELIVTLEGIPLKVLGHYYKGCPERGEWGYSLGTPAEPPSFSISQIFVGDTDATDFFNNYVRARSVHTEGRTIYQYTDAMEVIEELCLESIKQH